MNFEVYNKVTNEKYGLSDEFIKKYPKRIANVSDVLVHPHVYDVMPKYAKQLRSNQEEKWVGYIRHHYYDIPGESEYDQGLRLFKELIDAHPELVGLVKVSDDSGKIVDYVPEKLFKFDEKFIEDHLSDLIICEDYIPIDLNKYPSQEPDLEFDTAQDDREFWFDRDMIQTYKEMNDIILQKCIAYEDRIKAFNCVIIEWLDWHPEFEGIIAKESLSDYQTMKNNNEFTFTDLLFDVKLPSEEKPAPQYEYRDDVIYKDDSNRMFPDFKKMDAIYDKYGASLLAAYLAYLV